MIKESRIGVLKMRLRSLYSKYNNILDKYSCGKNLAEHISSDLSHVKVEFNETFSKLKKLDPKCPEFKL